MDADKEQQDQKVAERTVGDKVKNNAALAAVIVASSPVFSAMANGGVAEAESVGIAAGLLGAASIWVMSKLRNESLGKTATWAGTGAARLLRSAGHAAQDDVRDSRKIVQHLQNRSRDKKKQSGKGR